MNTIQQQQKPNLTKEIFADFLRKILTKEQQVEYNEMMKQCPKDGIVMNVEKVFDEEEEMNECEICGCNMTEENTRYVEDSDTIIMCDKCEE